MNGNKVNARYTSSGVDEYKGNPFIEALPKILDAKETIESLREVIVKNESAIQKPKEDRVHEIARLSHRFFQPLTAHLDLSRKVSLMIRGGYVGRNPRNGDYKKQLQNGYERIQTGELNSYRFDDVASTAQSMALIGCSGSGKTTTLNKILFNYPAVIYHEEMNLDQVVYLRIDCSHNGSLKEICINFFRALDKVIGSDYESKYGLKRLSIESMMAVMSQLANSHALGLLVIDEIQHLIKSKAGVTDAMMNFFVTMVNIIGIPVIMVGTPKALPLFEGDFRSGRRAAGFGAVYWSPLDPTNSEKDKQEWEGFTNSLWKLQCLQKRDLLLTDEIRDVWFELSQGITDIVIKLFILAQLRAITTGHERITPALFKQVYKDELKPIHRMIEALRSKDPEKIARYSDLMIPDIERRLYQITQQIRETPVNTAEDKALEKLGTDEQKKIFLMLADDYNHNDLVRVIQEVCLKDKTAKYTSILANAIEILEKIGEGKKTQEEKKEPKKANKKQKDWSELETDDLRYVSSQSESPQEMHDKLKQRDMVRDLSDFIGNEK